MTELFAYLMLLFNDYFFIRLTIAKLAASLVSNRHAKSCARVICLLNAALYPEVIESSLLPRCLMLRLPHGWPISLSANSADINPERWSAFILFSLYRMT